MTLIFRGPQATNKALQGLQVGPADVLATYTSLSSAWGWMCGLSSIKFILSHFRNSVIPVEALNKLGVELCLSPVDAIVLTTQGPQRCETKGTDDAFDSDPRLQLIGSTICALDHELGHRLALELFLEYLGPILFTKAKELKEQLHGQLSDSLVRVINEGKARGFTQRFLAAIEQSGLPRGSGDRYDEVGGKSDIPLVAGLLRWIASGRRATYYTRSSRVVRVACCLKEIGYLINQIDFWSGAGAAPDPGLAGRLVLVLGGTMQTDSLSDDYQRSDGGDYFSGIYHYHLNTAGAMFCNALNDNNNFRPEKYQDFFDKTYAYVKKHLHFEWNCDGGSKLKSPIKPQAVWQETPKPSRKAVRLASIRFNRSAEYLAPCYHAIDDYENEIVSVENGTEFCEELPDSVIDHRVITASVIIAIASRLAPESFDTCRHSCSMFLGDPDWLEKMASLIDHILTSHKSVRLWKAVGVLAVVHAAAPHINMDDQYAMDYSRLIGWRDGTYAVIPRLLVEWAATKDSLGLHCLDRFWANAVVHPDGSIQSAESPFMGVDMVVPDLHHGSAGTVVGEGPFAGPATVGFADDMVHLSLERTVRVETPDLGICARIDGDSVGFVGIADVLRTLVESLTASQGCVGHDSGQAVAYNVRTRAWCESRVKKPVSKGLVTLVSAKDDPLWSVFLAGQSGFGLVGRVSYGCFLCASRGLGENSFVVGFQS